MKTTMRFASSGSRGQASLEFILVLIFMLVIMAAVVVPLGQRVQFAMDDVSKVGFADAGLKVIASSISNMTIIPGDSRQIVDIYLPKGSTFFCNNNGKNVGITFPLNSDVFDATGQAPADCVENPSDPAIAMLCSKDFVFPSFVELRCQGDAAPDASFTLDVGQSGFTQTFRMAGRYFSSGNFRYIIDFNAS